ncbi:MAG: DUF1515 domain-containing protein [Mesorhizobium sp.]|nr:DUF1515 domain-containing protein [Mesorhizobium sp. M8A.F.Ca.ET.023.01.1.1]TIW90612.1 MAG: DUF1515 domain-containing protein [Mesorhizobium sp.]
MASLEDIFLALGRVQEGVEQLREDFQEEKRNAHESRTALHRRLDEQAAEISSLKTDVAIHGKIEAQVRNEVRALGDKVEANQKAVQPSVDDWKRMKTLGIGIAGLLALGGLSFGAFIMWAGDAAATAVRHWLKIN